jgi:carbohydrate-binding DOMON domain-containing protein
MDAFREVDTELTDKIRKRIDEIVHRVEVEQQGDVYYWYDRDNRKFLAQGQTTEEIIDVIKNRFPEHIFYFEESNHLISAKHNWEPVPARLSDKS